MGFRRAIAVTLIAGLALLGAGCVETEDGEDASTTLPSTDDEDGDGSDDGSDDTGTDPAPSPSNVAPTITSTPVTRVMATALRIESKEKMRFISTIMAMTRVELAEPLSSACSRSSREIMCRISFTAV